MYEKILIPVDFSEWNKAGIAHAARLAGKQSHVTLMHVIEQIDHLNEDEDRAFYQRLTTLANDRMQALVDYSREQGLEPFTQIAVGKRALQIIDYARDNEVSLIVLNSRLMDLTKPLDGFGGTSHTIAVYANCPVFLVK